MAVEPKRAFKGNVKIWDSDGEHIVPPFETKEVGYNELYTSQQALGDILKELKIMNLHLSILTDNTINKTEVE